MEQSILFTGVAGASFPSGMPKIEEFKITTFFEVANRNLTLQNLFFLEEIVKFNSQSECGFFGFAVKKSKEKSTDWAERSTRFLLIVC